MPIKPVRVPVNGKKSYLLPNACIICLLCTIEVMSTIHSCTFYNNYFRVIDNDFILYVYKQLSKLLSALYGLL